MSAAIKCDNCGTVADSVVDDGFAMNRPARVVLPDGWYRVVVLDSIPGTYQTEVEVCSPLCAAGSVQTWATVALGAKEPA